jgi:hypothetical protein
MNPAPACFDVPKILNPSGLKRNYCMPIMTKLMVHKEMFIKTYFSKQAVLITSDFY